MYIILQKEMSAQEQLDQRSRFEFAMKDAGWIYKRDIWGHIFNWEHENGYKVDDRSAFDFWKMSALTPAPW